jgi:hydrogenase nickel incorporation protein HypB
MDLIKHLNFNLERVLVDIHALNPNAEVFRLSATTGEGMQQWYNWLLKRAAK